MAGAVLDPDFADPSMAHSALTANAIVAAPGTRPSVLARNPPDWGRSRRPNGTHLVSTSKPCERRDDCGRVRPEAPRDRTLSRHGPPQPEWTIAQVMRMASCRH